MHYGRTAATWQGPGRDLAKGPNSFGGDTMVWIRETLLGGQRKRIDDIQIGDEVAAWNPTTGGYDYKPVTRKSSRLADQINRLTLRSADGRAETLRTTFNHPFLRADAGTGDHRVLMEPAGDWTAAGRLQGGDQIKSANGEPLSVVAIAADNDPARVYSLEVAGLQSFAVGDQGAWGHNSTGGKKKSDSSANEKHGDGGRALTKAEQQIEALEAKLCPGMGRKERLDIEQKIKNIRKAAEKAKKGEEHGRRGR
jgi:Pretoxin HINT domain